MVAFLEAHDCGFLRRAELSIAHDELPARDGEPPCSVDLSAQNVEAVVDGNPEESGEGERVAAGALTGDAEVEPAGESGLHCGSGIRLIEIQPVVGFVGVDERWVEEVHAPLRVLLLQHVFEAAHCCARTGLCGEQAAFRRCHDDWRRCLIKDVRHRESHGRSRALCIHQSEARCRIPLLLHRERLAFALRIVEHLHAIAECRRRRLRNLPRHRHLRAGALRADICDCGFVESRQVGLLRGECVLFVAGNRRAREPLRKKAGRLRVFDSHILVVTFGQDVQDDVLRLVDRDGVRLFPRAILAEIAEAPVQRAHGFFIRERLDETRVPRKRRRRNRQPRRADVMPFSIRVVFDPAGHIAVGVVHFPHATEHRVPALLLDERPRRAAHRAAASFAAVGVLDV